ncbi:MAG: TetR/AcrR family transcriptional regulator [Rhizobiales bacterium]|nr:TetR/AcrR family transcriptional regulator [Hyphomicrobiales bacterium]
MSELEDVRRRVVNELLVQAEQRDWSELTLAELARGAGIDLATMRRAFPSMAAVLKAYVRRIDDTVLERASRELDASAEPRERLFDVVMMRFEAMAGDRAAIGRIVRTAGLQTDLVKPLLNSQRWMLAAAGFPVDGPGGLARTLGLAAIYSDAFGCWLDDDDPGMARTMARLDKRLRRSEQLVRNTCDAAGGLVRLACEALGGARRARRASEAGDGGPTGEAAGGGEGPTGAAGAAA